MSAVALIKFTQGVLVGTPGQVLIGQIGTSVLVENDVNTDVASWQIDLVYTPPGSALPISIPLAFNNNSNTPLVNFTPDIFGPYRLELKVWEVLNRVGTPVDSDIRVFWIREPRHNSLIPPYQNDPIPKLTIASGEPGAKFNELNVSGQEFGWDGRGTAGLVHDLLKILASSNYDLLPYPVAEGVAAPIGVGGAPIGRAPIIKEVSSFTSTNLDPNGFDPRLFNPVASIYDGTFVVTVSSQRGRSGYARFNPTTNRYEDGFESSAGIGLTILDMVSLGTTIWVVGYRWNPSTDFLEGVIVGFTSGGSPSPMFVIRSDAPLTSIDFDGTHLWAASSGSPDILYKIHPSSLGVPVASLVITAGEGDTVRADPNGANYGDTNPRVYVSGAGGGLVRRITAVGAPTVDGTVGTFTNRPRIATGGGFIWLVDGFILGKFLPDPFVISTIKTYGVYYPLPGVNTLSVDPLTGKVWLSGVGPIARFGDGSTSPYQQSRANTVLLQVNPSTLAVEANVVLPTGIPLSDWEDLEYGTGPQNKMLFLGDSVFVTDPSYGNPQGNQGSLYRVDTTTLEVIYLPQPVAGLFAPLDTPFAKYANVWPDISTAQDGQVAGMSDFFFNNPVSVRTDGRLAWILNSNRYSATGGNGFPVPTKVASVTRRSRAYIPGTPLIDDIPISSDSAELFRDIVFDGAQFWAIGWHTTGGFSFIRQILVPADTYAQRGDPPAIGATYGFGPNFLYDGIFDGTYLWLLTATEVIRVDPLSPAGPYSTVITGATDHFRILFNTFSGKLFVTSEAGTVYRINPTTVLVDGSVVLSSGGSTSLSGVTGTSFVVYVVGDDSVGTPTIWGVSPTTLTVFPTVSLVPAIDATGFPVDAMHFPEDNSVVILAEYTTGSPDTVVVCKFDTLTSTVLPAISVVGWEDAAECRLSRTSIVIGATNESPFVWAPALHVTPIHDLTGTGVYGAVAMVGVGPIGAGSVDNINTAISTQEWIYPLRAPIDQPPAASGISASWQLRTNAGRWEIRSFKGKVQEIVSPPGTGFQWTNADVVLVNNTNGIISISLTGNAIVIQGMILAPKMVTFVDVAGTAAANPIRIVPQYAGVIHGAGGVTYTAGSPYEISTNYGAVTLVAVTNDPGGSLFNWNVVGEVKSSGGLTIANQVITTSPFTITTQEAIGVDRTATTTITLPSLTSPKILRIYDWAGTAGDFPITINPAGGHNIDGQSSYTIGTPFGAVELVWTNSSSRWKILNESRPNAIVTTSTATTTLTATNSVVLVDSLSGARTVNLPASPRRFEIQVIKDRDNNASVNNITIGQNGNTINGLASDYFITINGGSVKLIWTNTASSSFGWRVI
jgi:hypothetical protein